MLNDCPSPRAGLLDDTVYFEPPRDLRRAVGSLFAGLAVHAAIMLAMAALG